VKEPGRHPATHKETAMRGRHLIPCALIVAFAAGTARGQSDPWYVKSAKLQVQKLQAPSGEWALEYPRNWLASLGGGSTLAILLPKNAEASVTIERARMNVELSPKDLTDFFLVAEVELIKQEQRSAVAISQKIVGAPDGRVFIVQYERPGLKGPDRVRQYSLPVGGRVYRLQCAAPASAFGKYEPLFAHIAATLTVKEQP
jgi:hypothetical protein